MDYEIKRADTADYAELIRFAEMVFSVDFSKVRPNLYHGHPDQAEYHLLVTEGDQIKALVGSFPLELRIGGMPLKLRGIGTVSVHPDSRGKGYMKLLMKRQIDEAIADHTDLMFLGGQRQRYGYFGFERGVTEISFHVSPTNRRHHQEISTEEIRLIPLADHPEYTEDCHSLYRAQDVTSVRDADRFCEILRTGTSSGWVILKNDGFLGYASIAEDGSEVNELILNDNSLAQETVFRIVEHFSRDVQFFPTWNQRELIRALDGIAEDCSVQAEEMVYVTNYPRVIEAYLNLKGSHSALADGKIVLEIQGAGRFAIIVENNRAQVSETTDAPDRSLSHLEAMRYLFSPSSLPLYETALERSWLPIPIIVPRPDDV